MPTIAACLMKFLEYVEIERGRSPKTVESYDRVLRDFFRFGKIQDPKDITLDMIRKYRIFLNRNKLSEAVNSRNHPKLSQHRPSGVPALPRKRGNRLGGTERIEMAKVPERQVDFLEPENWSGFLPRRKGKAKLLVGSRAPRTPFFIGTSRFGIGWSRSGVGQSRTGEFSVRGKGGKVRMVFVSDRARAVISSYLEVRKDIDPALFVSTTKGFARKTARDDLRITVRTVERIVARLATKPAL
jgi:hypothetical protein